MSDPKIILPFAPQKTPRSEEMAYNAARWAALAKKELPQGVGFIFAFFPKGEAGNARGVVVSNIGRDLLHRELQAMLRRGNEQSRIIIPES